MTSDRGMLLAAYHLKAPFIEAVPQIMNDEARELLQTWLSP